MFDALKYTKNLEAAGVPREQAEAQVQLVIAAIEDEVATKNDIAQLKQQMTELKADIIFQLGALIVTCTTLGFSGIGKDNLKSKATDFISVKKLPKNSLAQSKENRYPRINATGHLLFPSSL